MDKSNRTRIRNLVRIMLYIASDHAGYTRKEQVKIFLEKNRIKYKDLGPSNNEKRVDYPDYAKKVCKKILLKPDKNKGILICGSGTGMSMAANRFKKIRAVIGYDIYSAKMSRRDNDSNVLCLRALKFSLIKTIPILKTWFSTSPNNDPRYKIRAQKLDR